MNQGVQQLDEIPSAEGADEAISAELRAAFALLPERQRQALFLREWQGCSYAEIAEALGTSESAVDTLLVRARRTLARSLGGRRRRAGDAAGLLGWIQLGFGSSASKVAVAVVAAAAAGSGVAAERHSQGIWAHPPVAVVAAPAERAEPPVVRGRGVHRDVPRPQRAKPPAQAITHIAPTPATTLARPEEPAQAPEPPAPAAAPSQPASEPVTAPTDPTPPTTTTTTTTVVATVPAVASSVLDSAVQTVSTAAPPIAPVVSAAAQTIDRAVQTAANTAQSAVTTATGLLGN